VRRYSKLGIREFDDGQNGGTDVKRWACSKIIDTLFDMNKINIMNLKLIKAALS
jgi:hypothetical protein